MKQYDWTAKLNQIKKVLYMLFIAVTDPALMQWQTYLLKLNLLLIQKSPTCTAQDAKHLAPVSLQLSRRDKLGVSCRPGLKSLFREEVQQFIAVRAIRPYRALGDSGDTYLIASGPETKRYSIYWSWDFGKCRFSRLRWACWVCFECFWNRQKYNSNIQHNSRFNTGNGRNQTSQFIMIKAPPAQLQLWNHSAGCYLAL